MVVLVPRRSRNKVSWCEPHASSRHPLWVTSIMKLATTKGECPLCGRVLRPYHVDLGVSLIFAVEAHMVCLILETPPVSDVNNEA